MLCIGLAVSLFGWSLAQTMDLDGAEYMLVGFLFVVPGSPYFLLGAAVRHLRSERERRALIGAFAGVLPTLLVFAPLLQVYPRSVDGPLEAGKLIYWLPLVLPVTAGVGVASALLWPARSRAPKSTSGNWRQYKAKLVDGRPVAWRSSLFLATLGMILGAGFAVVVWLVDLAYPRGFWAIAQGSPAFAIGVLATVFRTRRAFYGLVGALFGSLLAPLGGALIAMDSSDYRGGGVNFTLAFMAVLSLPFAAGAMALCSAAGRRWYRLQCGEPGRSLLARDYPVYSDEPPARFWRRGGTGP